MAGFDPRTMLRAMGWHTTQLPVPVIGGMDTLIWRVETAAGPLALRVLRARAAQMNVARREARVMDWLTGQDVPVPRIHAFGEFAGRPGLLMDWVPGEPLASALFAQPELAAQLGAASADMQTKLHGLAVPPDSLEPLDQPGLTTVPAARPSLLHLDFHPLNVLVCGTQVRGIIDWSNARLGDARADVARSLSILSVDPVVWTLSGHERAALLAFRRAYCAALPPESLQAVFLAWAGDYLQADLSQPHTAEALRHVVRWTTWWRNRV